MGEGTVLERGTPSLALGSELRSKLQAAHRKRLPRESPGMMANNKREVQKGSTTEMKGNGNERLQTRGETIDKR